MDLEMLIEALVAPAPDDYFSLREHFPFDLIEAEVSLLEPEQQQRFREKETAWALRGDNRKRVLLDPFLTGIKEEFIVVGPGRLIYASRPRQPIVINGKTLDCDVLVSVQAFPDAVL